MEYGIPGPLRAGRGFFVPLQTDWNAAVERRTILIAVVIMAFLGAYLGKRALERDGGAPPANTPTGQAQEAPDRVVSMAPSITEILFALDLGDLLVGRTRYCDYPPEALQSTSIGGFYEPNYEAITQLEPDLVILLPDHERPAQRLAALGIPTLEVQNGTVEQILDAIRTVGDECGAPAEAAELVQSLRSRMERVERLTANLPRPAVLVSVGRNMGSGDLQDVYVAGAGSFFDELIRLAGGRNAYSGDLKYPTVSQEGIIRMNPQVVIDIIPDLAQKNIGRDAVLAEWSTVPGVDAVDNDRVYVFGQDYVAVPGPRFVLILEQMARVLHPEVDRE
jgi:iron complex transport system substrate-binding protein